MSYQKMFLLFLCAWPVFRYTQASGQEHVQHGVAGGTNSQAPKVFLDKSPRVVEYQLKRLSNTQLLAIETALDHPKYLPVFAAISLRPGMSADQRATAVNGLAKVSEKSVAKVVFEQLAKLQESDREQQRVAKDLTEILVRRDSMQSTLEDLEEGAKQKNAFVVRAAMAALVHVGKMDVARKIAESNDTAQIGLLTATSIVPDATKRTAMREFVLDGLKPKLPAAIRMAAITTLPDTGDDASSTFSELARIVLEQPDEPELEGSAVRSLLKLKGAPVSADLAQKLTTYLVTSAEGTPAAQRTADRFLDKALLIESLLPSLPEVEAKSLRSRLQAILVRVVKIKTVAEEMRYDIKHFVAEAGKPIQLVLQNEDLMPHNLVIVQPGTLKDVALQAATMAPDALTDGKQYVPNIPQVLFATKMIQAEMQDRLTFTAPQAPGEYPFVCTYPNHWLRMYGVMVVVPDVDAFLKNPVEPKDPLGNNRSFVKNWKLDDFEGKLKVGLRGRSREIGARIFAEATCLQCHVLRNQGGRVGPELDTVFKRHEGNAMTVLREIIEPSHKVDPKYATHSLLTLDGQVFSGVIVSEDDKSISLLSSPDQPKPNVIQRAEIDDIVQSPKSMMPAALMDQFTLDEIFELLAYIENPSGN